MSISGLRKLLGLRRNIARPPETAPDSPSSAQPSTPEASPTAATFRKSLLPLAAHAAALQATSVSGSGHGTGLLAKSCEAENLRLEVSYLESRMLHAQQNFAEPSFPTILI